MQGSKMVYFYLEIKWERLETMDGVLEPGEDDNGLN